MFADESSHLTAHVVAFDGVDIQAIQERFGRTNASFFMTSRSPPALKKLCCRRLSKVVRNSREHYSYFSRIRQSFNQLASAIDRQQRVHEHIAFRMPLRILRHIYQRG